MIRIGFDIGGSEIAAIALDQRGRELARLRGDVPRDYDATQADGAKVSGTFSRNAGDVAELRGGHARHHRGYPGRSRTQPPRCQSTAFASRRSSWRWTREPQSPTSTSLPAGRLLFLRPARPSDAFQQVWVLIRSHAKGSMMCAAKAPSQGRKEDTGNMQSRVAEAWLLAALLLLTACAGLPQTVEDPLAAEACDVTRERLAAAQPGTPETAALAARIASNCETLGRDYAEALRASALAGAATPIPDLRSPQDPAERLDGATRQVQVVLWTDQRTVERFYAGEGGTTPPGQPVVWVTLAPELQEWCARLDWSDPAPEAQAAGYQRISQRLGLPPYALNDRFVLLWVEPERLLRPCADPNPARDACGVAFPDSIEAPDLTREAYAAWFTGNVGNSYTPSGAPWTRYGWTYDWAADAEEPPYGASEFMLAPSTDYRIEAVQRAAAYCTP
jgi:hypothetical protein